MRRKLAKVGFTLAAVLASAVVPRFSLATPAAPGPASPLGVWRGSSTCTDLAAAPGCRDEAVVYEFTVGAQPGTVRWKAEFKSPRVHSLWCLTVDGAHMTGTGQLLPGKQTIRKINVRKD